MSLQTGDLAVGRLPQDGTPRTAIRAHELRKVYGQGDTAVAALDGVSVDFGVGRFTAIMGPSGSGKSTLMHCLAGLDTPTSGQVLLGETELTQLPDAELTKIRRDRVGFVFQSYNLIPSLAAAENAGLPGRLARRRGAARQPPPKSHCAQSGWPTVTGSSPASWSSTSTPARDGTSGD